MTTPPGPQPTPAGARRPVPDDASPPAEELVGSGAAPQLGRRQLLRWIVAGGLTSGALGSLAAACVADDTSGAGDDRQLTEAEVAIARVGRRYREVRPEEDDAAVLLGLLAVDPEAVSSPGDLRSLSAEVLDDYGAGRTVRLDGWVLSVTEGRAAALLSLS